MKHRVTRCDWATQSELEQLYHDTQWGRPVFDDRELFKMLILEGMQAGLSWRTILQKMPAFCEAFDQFDPQLIARYDEQKVAALMQNKGIIRNRLKIKAAITNAQAFERICAEFGTFSNYIWGFVDHRPIINEWRSQNEVPAFTELAEIISRDLKKKGFKFVGPTVVYAYMQSVGMVNDHLVTCSFRES